MATWQQLVQEAQEECRRLQPGPDCVGFLLSRPAQSLAAARWLFPEAAIQLATPPDRPDQITIRIQLPSLTLTDWHSFKHFREMIDHASTAAIRPMEDHLLIELYFGDVWLEKQH